MGEVRGEQIRRHRLEDLAEEIFTHAEQGRRRLDDIVAGSTIDAVRDTLRDMTDAGLLAVRDGEVILTAEGDRLATEIVRRHRLAETLFSQLFDVPEEEAERTACEFEHILSPQVTTSVCTYLGHPPACPHGKPIPRGACCSTYTLEMEPLVRRLADLPLGGEGSIVFMAPDSRSRLARLSGLGVIPGAVLKLIQKRPSVVVEVGQTTLALDRAIADEIFVKRTEP